jgi:hypothetical protein
VLTSPMLIRVGLLPRSGPHEQYACSRSSWNWFFLLLGEQRDQVTPDVASLGVEGIPVAARADSASRAPGPERRLTPCLKRPSKQLVVRLAWSYPGQAMSYRRKSSIDGVSIKDKIIIVSFKSKGKRAIAASVAGLGVRQTPRARRGGIFPALVACAVAVMSVAAVGVVVWAPIPRAHLMVSLVAGMARWLTSSGG